MGAAGLASGPAGARPAGRTARRAGASVRAVLLIAFAAVPFTYAELLLGGLLLRPWTLVLAVMVPLVLAMPINLRAVRHLLPYLAWLAYGALTLSWTLAPGPGMSFLAQLALPAAGYLLAWRARADEIRGPLARLSFWGIAAAAVMTVLSLRGLIGPETFSTRPTAMAVAALFVVATMDARSLPYIGLTTALALVVTFGTGSRMAAAVVILMLLLSPALLSRGGVRLLVAAGCVLLVIAVSGTGAFRERFFFSQDATLTDVLTLQQDVNTAGRREAWPRLIHECSTAQPEGLGLWSASVLSKRLTGGVLDHPHNEYIRVYCDTGWGGLALFCLFLVTALARSAWGVLRGPDPRLHLAAGLLMLAYALFAVTDNPLVYSAQFAGPVLIILGLSDRLLPARRRRDRRMVWTGETWFGPRRQAGVPAVPGTPGGSGG